MSTDPFIRGITQLLWAYVLIGALTWLFTQGMRKKDNEAAERHDFGHVGGWHNATLIAALAWPLFWAAGVTRWINRKRRGS